MSALLQFFAYEHLPPHLQAVSKPFGEAARVLETSSDNRPLRGTLVQAVIELVRVSVATLPENIERREAMRKLVELHSVMQAYSNGEGGIGVDAALRMLLEAKDCAVRALVFKP
jgi:hypothetical protein